MTMVGGDDLSTESQAIEFCGVGVRHGARVAVRDVSFIVPARQVTALLGPTGCGKSSLLMAVNRGTDAIPRCKVSGTIRWGTVDVRCPEIDATQLRRVVAQVSQRSNPFPSTIRRNLELPLLEHSVTRKDEIESRIEMALTAAGVWRELRDRLDRPAHDLSSGQQQRLCLARALVLQPCGLLLDDPCASLDSRDAAGYEALLQELKQRLTILLVSASPNQAKRVADRVALLWPNEEVGGLIEVGEASEFFKNPTHPTTASFLKEAGV